MSVSDILFGFLVAGGYFVSATVARLFGRPALGIIVGGVMGIAFSVVILSYGLPQFVADVIPPAAAN